MKKIFNFILVGVLTIYPYIALASGCATGYACLLKDLNDQDGVMQQIHKERVEKYYNPKTTEVSINKQKHITYKDILPLQAKYYISEKSD